MTANCLVKGYTGDTYCLGCNTKIAEGTEIAIDSTNHASEETELKNAKAATCTEDGYTGDECYKCCGAVKTAGSAINKHGHTAGTAVEENRVEATCKTEGSYDSVVYCSVCNAELSREAKTIAKKAHTTATREENRVEASCGKDGSYDLVTYCSVCKEVLSTEHKTITATGEHNYATEVEGTRSPATCVAEGSVTMSCGCGATKVVTIPIDSNNHANVVTDAAVAATCETAGKTAGSHCAACGKTIVAQTVIPAKGHAWGEWTVEKAATCTEKGFEKRVCANDASHVETRDTDMIAHTEEILPAVEATCTKTGLTEGKKCSVCSKILVAQTVVEKKAHTEVADAAVAATCESAGKTAGSHCSVCNTVIVAQTVIPALGHDYDYDNGVLTRPAFVDGAWVNGSYTYTCKNNAAHKTTVAAPRADYTEYDKLVADINNAIASGNLTQDAIDELNAALADNEVADNLIASEQADVDSAASALKGALDAVASSLKPDFTEIDKALGEYDDADAVVDVPSDVADRIDKIKDIINGIKNDPNATRADKQDDIDTLASEVNGYVSHLAECAKGNHAYSSEWTIDIEATCSHTGSKSHHCAYCGSTTARPEFNGDKVEIPKLTHSVSSWTETKAPTCTEDGEKTGTCDLCGAFVTEAVAKLGHNWSAWVRTKDSTCMEKGSETRSCDRCGEKQTRELPLVGHHSVILPRVEPTCEEKGLTEGAYCDVCGKILKDQTELPARGHLDMNGDGKCDACDCDYEGGCDCTCHNDSLWSKIARFIYTLFSKIFHKRIACCEDMEFWGGEIKDLT